MLHGNISNSRFPYTTHPGSGNKSCKVKASEKLRLSNILIDQAGVDEFMKVLYATGEKVMSIKLSDRFCRNRWGSAWRLERRVAIYRHTVWVFLHEVAHILDIKKSFTGERVAGVKPHGRDFGMHLSCLYEMYMEYCDKGIVNTPSEAPPVEQKPDPNKWIVPERRRRIVGGISLQVGDGVWFKARGTKIFARVVKVNKKTCRVKPIDGTPDWRVSPKLLNKTYLPKGN